MDVNKGEEGAEAAAQGVLTFRSRDVSPLTPRRGISVNDAGRRVSRKHTSRQIWDPGNVGDPRGMALRMRSVILGQEIFILAKFFLRR